jgi:hypothetical protein
LVGLLASLAGPLLFGLVTAAANASTTVLDFEGLGDVEAVSNYYNGGTGGDGSGPGPSLGVTFSPNAIAVIDSDAGGSGDFGGEPSPDTVMVAPWNDAATLDFPAGFDTGLSLYYSAIHYPGSITVYDGPGATGNVLAVLVLPVTPFQGGDPTGTYSPFFPIGVAFEGTAKSVEFAGYSPGQIGFDNIALGSETPPTPTPTATPTATPTPLVIQLLDAELVAAGSPVLQNGTGTLRLEDARLGRLAPSVFVVPEPGALWQLGAGIGFLALLARRRKPRICTAAAEAPGRVAPATPRRGIP